MIYSVFTERKNFSCSINLPSSKSISNRVLILNALSYSPFQIKNLSDSDDTLVLEEALFSNKNEFDIGHAGTAMRFLTAFLSKIAGVWIVTGSERMKQRPIAILVDALNQLGAKIEYIGQEGFPPIKIHGSHLKGKELELDGSISSQYISALLMIAPTLENGLTLKLNGNITSKPYIELTLKLMEYYGVRHFWKENSIIIPEQTYFPQEFTVEADWSGASYWYEILALSISGEIMLENLQLESLQGDSNIEKWFSEFGIVSIQKKEGVLISKQKHIQPQKLEINFIENPDVAQTMACICVALNIPFNFLGLKTLKIKETNRILALQNELLKFGAILTEPSEGELSWDGLKRNDYFVDIPEIETYHDHRMALAFAPMAAAGSQINIKNPDVVSKSYPGFWIDLKKAGFTITVNPDKV